MDINLDSLNEQQKQAVIHGTGPLLIVAGAGTGKTTVITQRINYLIQEKKIATNQILALTFTEKAAGEMEERVDKALPYGYVDLWVSTFHAFCERILKLHALDIGLPQNFKLLDQTQGWLLVKKNLDKFNLDYYRPLGNPTKFIHALLQHFSRCKDEEIYPEDYLKYAENLKIDLDDMEGSGGKAKIKNKELKITNNDEEIKLNEISRLNEIANAYHIYQQILLDNNSLDFGDLINYTLRLFKSRPQILKIYQKQFKYILVDEFQDTNWAQYELIKLLASPKNNITVVGDDDQSIYKFRGASVSNILNFKKDYPESREIFLQTNYRSSQNILDLSYQFIQLNNPDRLEVKLKSTTSKLSKKLHSAAKKSGEVIYNYFNSLDEEVSKTVDTILTIKEKNPELNWNEFAILVRANDSASEFVQELESRHVPYQFFASRGLYFKPVILDIINYLRLLDDYRESPSLYRILNLPMLNISIQQIINLNYWSSRKAWSLFETLRNINTIPQVLPATVKEIQKLVAWIDKHSLLAKEKPVTKVILDFLEISGYTNYISKLEPEKAQVIFSYLQQFLKKAKDFEKSFADNKVADFLDELELELEAGEQGTLAWDMEAGPEAVNIMTIHAAKGLEFAYVFLPNLVDKRFPTIERKEAIELPDKLVKDILPEGDAHLQEERRLLYVAMTRAKQGLFLSGAKDYGGLRIKKPSQFLYELGLVKDSISQTTKKKESLIIVEKNNKVNTQPIMTGYQLPKSFSYSQISSFQTCPLQYKYAYLLRIPVKGKYTFSFGSSIHQTLQKFFEQVKAGVAIEQTNLFGSGENKIKSLPTEADLLKIYEQVWIDDWYDSKSQQEEYKKKGKEALKLFYKEWEKEKIVPERLENRFKLQVGEFVLSGAIDRVDRLLDGSVEIIDYKTGQSKEKLEVDNKRQLLIYQLAAAQHLKEKVSKLTYYYVEDGKKLSFLGKAEDLEDIKEKIIATINKIKQSEFTPTPSPQMCKFCDFNKICEFSQAK
jgi:DNA helicase-2/ATP-dependent DNA helicase PcrA